MVITYIICTICIICIILCVLAGWLKSIGSQIVYELDHKSPYFMSSFCRAHPGKSSSCANVPVADTGITCATCFQSYLATASRVLAMDAGCGLSAREQWRGPVTCNEWDGEFCQCQAPYTTLQVDVPVCPNSVRVRRSGSVCQASQSRRGMWSQWHCRLPSRARTARPPPAPSLSPTVTAASPARRWIMTMIISARPRRLRLLCHGPSHSELRLWLRPTLPVSRPQSQLVTRTL
jgi:hypothetical protein